MGKVKIGLYRYHTSTAVILTIFLQKCSLRNPVSNIILSKDMNFIDCHGNGKAKFAQIIKIISSEAIYMQGIKLKLCRNVHNLNLCKKWHF